MKRAHAQTAIADFARVKSFDSIITQRLRKIGRAIKHFVVRSANLDVAIAQGEGNELLLKSLSIFFPAAFEVCDVAKYSCASEASR